MDNTERQGHNKMDVEGRQIEAPRGKDCRGNNPPPKKDYATGTLVNTSHRVLLVTIILNHLLLSQDVLYSASPPALAINPVPISQDRPIS